MNIFKTTIDGIIADITAKIDKLALVAEAHKIEAELHTAAIARRQALLALAVSEEARARSIAAKFKELIS